ncbi:MAG: hypothetical protein JSS34_00455 [Proteobacteria bacterium]|nr:hypothetical protein [Pseudomonadota bacterium]
MIIFKYISIAWLISMVYVFSSQAKVDVSGQKLTPKICNRILLEPDSDLRTCEVCLKQVLRTSLTRAEYVQTLKASQGGETLAPGTQGVTQDSLEENTLNPPASQIIASESSESSHEDAVVTSAPTSVESGGKSSSIPAENDSSSASQNAVSLQPIVPEAKPSLEPASLQSASGPVLVQASSEAVNPKGVIESQHLLASTLSPAPVNNILSSQGIPAPKALSKEPASRSLLSSQEVRALQDHLPDPVLQRTRAIQTAENSISSLMENVRSDQEKIKALRENIEKNKAIISGELPLPKGATLKGLQSRIEVDRENIVKQENHIQDKTKEVQTLKEKAEKLQGEIHVILKGDEAKGILASRYASKLEGKQGEIVRKQATHDLSILTYNEAQQAYAASAGISFGFGFPIEQQMKNQRLIDHLFSLAEQLREDGPDNRELAEQMELQAEQLKSVTPASPQKKLADIKYKKK